MVEMDRVELSALVSAARETGDAYLRVVADALESLAGVWDDRASDDDEYDVEAAIEHLSDVLRRWACRNVP